MNSALLMKGLWNFYNSRSLPWVQLLLQKHYKRRLATATILPSRCSPIWKGVLSTSAPFHASALFSLGNGSTVNFWDARWSGDYLLRNRFPRLHATATHRHLSVRKWMLRFASRSNMGFGAHLSPEGQREFSLLSSVVQSISLSDSSDSISWRWSNNGLFAVRSAYYFLIFDGVDNRKIPHLWSLRIPLRLKLFLWLAARNRLLTSDLLMKRGWHGPSICPLCRADDENLEHLFFCCIYARSVWSRLLQGYPYTHLKLLNTNGDIAIRWRRARSTLTGQSQGTFDICVAVTCWELWKEHNTRIFYTTVSRSEECGRRVVTTIRAWTQMLRA